MASAAVAPNAGAAPQKTSHPFTCVTCAIAFRSSELQRGHMRSDWHRYNLKRRVASLPPLSSEVFADKVLSAQATSKAAAEKASFEKSCQACEKTYFSENAFKNHLGSQRHRMRLAALQNGGTPDDASSVMSSTVSLGEPIAPEDVDDPAVTADFQDVISGMKGTNISDDDSSVGRRPSRPHHSADGSAAPSLPDAGTETPSVADTADTVTSTAMPIHRCMFCNYDSTTLDTNITHMTRQHGLFIPEQEYLDDLEGLISYLQSKVTENCECLFCHKLKSTVPGIQTHMRDKGHCMIAFNTEDEMLEVGQFYDFRSTYSDEEDEEDDTDEDDEVPRKSNGGKLGAARQAADEEDEEWESDEEDDEDDDSSDTSTEREASKRTQRNNAIGAYIADGELFLPSGRMAGHRQFRRYFRQNLRSYPTAEEREEQQQKLLESRAHEDGESEQQNGDRRNRQLVSRANGGLGMLGVSDATKRGIQTQEQKDARKAQAKALRYEMRVQRKANNQTHFRDDNFGWR